MLAQHAELVLTFVPLIRHYMSSMRKPNTKLHVLMSAQNAMLVLILAPKARSKKHSSENIEIYYSFEQGIEADTGVHNLDSLSLILFFTSPYMAHQ